MEDSRLCLLSRRTIATSHCVFFILVTLRAVTATDTPYFSTCKENAGATDIEGLIEKDPCMFRCPPQVKMVCANDGMSHLNDCFLCKSACQSQHRPIFKVCDGRCPCKGKPHDEDIMETAEGCVDGNCATDAKDHYTEDYGYDVEDPVEKYTSPNKMEDNAYVLHESKGFTPAEDGEEDDDEDDGEMDEDEDGEMDEFEDGEEDEEDEDQEDIVIVGNGDDF